MSPRVAIVVGVALMVLTATAGVVASRKADEQGGEARAPGLRASQLPEGLGGKAAPAFSLPDALGTRVASDDLAGKPYALTFLFTRCPDVCPVIAQELKQAVANLGDRGEQVGLVAVSVDPKGDTRDAVRRWAARQRMPASLRYAIGTEQQLRPVWQRYFAAPRMTGRPETSTHAAAVWLVDAGGRLRARYPAGSPVDPEDLSHDLGVLLDEAA